VLRECLIVVQNFLIREFIEDFKMNGKKKKQSLFLLSLFILFFSNQPQNLSAGEIFSSQLKKPFTIVLLPDTQKYKIDSGIWRKHLFDSQTQWIANHIVDQNIKAVFHMGDIVDVSNDIQWSVAFESLSFLDGLTPYILTEGNHDILELEDAKKSSYRSAADLFHKYVPLTKFNSQPWFGGVFEDEKIENAYYFFTFGDTEFLVLTLEYGPRDVVLDWANKVAKKHPEKKIMVITHAYMAKGSQRLKPKPKIYPKVDQTPYGATEFKMRGHEGFANGGDVIWDKFIKHHPNIYFVFSGHSFGPGKRIDKGVFGNLVYQIGVNYQWEENGGDGYLTLLKFFPGDNKIGVSTYSPLLNKFKESFENNFIVDLKKGTFSKLENPKFSPFFVKGKKFSGEVKRLNNFGKLAGKWNFESGILNGETKFYYPNGNLKLANILQNGLQEGVQKSYFSNGKLREEYVVAQGKLEGKASSYFPKGNLRRTFSYHDNLMSGVLKSFSNDGHLVAEIPYKNNKIDGIQKSYFPSGELHKKLSYKEGALEGEAAIYFSPQEIQNYQAQSKDKKKYEFVKLAFSHTGGAKNGIGVEYYPNGLLRNLTTYDEGLRDGIVLEFLPNGALRFHWQFVNDKREGISKVYHDNGKLKVALNFVDDKEQGDFKVFDRSGNYKETIIFRDGKLKNIIK